MKEIPDIAIFRVGSQFRVEICGKPIERLRSFEIKVSNERGRGGLLGIAEYPHYTVEQYMEPANPDTLNNLLSRSDYSKDVKEGQGGHGDGKHRREDQ